VFLKVGEDLTVKPQNDDLIGIGSDRHYQSNFTSQVLGVVGRRLFYSFNDFITIILLGVPLAAIIVAAILYHNGN
jgi:hypothetical protein